MEEPAIVVPDRAADGSEIIETVVVETPNDVRTDPDGQSSEPDVAKDQPVTEVENEADVDNNDSGFIECDKSNYLFLIRCIINWNIKLLFLFIYL